MTLNLEPTVDQVFKHLADHHFVPRDSDGSDLQFGDDRGLRFKVGTSYGEVAIQVWRVGQPVHVIRILNEVQLEEAKHEMDRIISEHQAWIGGELLMTEYIDVVFTVPPGPESQFIEVEDDEGKSVKVGEWIAPRSDPDMPDDPYWRLRIGWTAIGDLT